MFSWMMVPNSLILLFVRNSEMAKVDTVGMNTIRMPEVTPGIDRGTVTFQKALHGVAPRSTAAST